MAFDAFPILSCSEIFLNHCSLSKFLLKTTMIQEILEKSEAPLDTEQQHYGFQLLHPYFYQVGDKCCQMICSHWFAESHVQLAIQ